MNAFEELCELIVDLQNDFDNPETRDRAKKEMISLWRRMNPSYVRPQDTPATVNLSDEDAMVIASLRPDQWQFFEPTRT